MDRFLSGRRVLVVGGSGGVGAAISLATAHHGARLLIHGGHSRDRLESVAARAATDAESVDTVLHELAGPSDVQALLDFAGSVDVLVVSFGPYLEAAIGDTSADDWSRMVGLNLIVPSVLVSRLIPGMVSRGYGRIILFGGPRSDRLEGYLQIAAYGAAKHGLASLTRSVARQYAGNNVRCNMICPGYVDTEYYSLEQKKQLTAARPAVRFVSVEEIASLVIHLLRPDSDPVNGALIPVDYGI